MSEFDVTDGTDADSTLVRDLRKQLKDAHKERDDALSKVASFESAARGTTVKEALAKAGAKPGLARFYPSDAEVSEEAINAWLDDNGEDFGFVRASAEEGGASNGAASTTTNPGLAAAQQIQQATAGALPGGPITRDQLLDLMGQTKNPAEYAALMERVVAGVTN